jgi:phosphopantothenoylcysteine synthetase/decarboxylase
MGSDFNAGVVLFADGTKHALDRMPKRDMAERILDLVLPHLPKK